MPITAATSVSEKKESFGHTGCRPSGMPTTWREGWSEELFLPENRWDGVVVKLLTNEEWFLE